MNNIIRHSYNGAIISQESDGYVCLTDMAKASGKQVNDYLRLDVTKAYLEGLSMETGIPVLSLINIVKGGNPQNQGTWAHPKIAVDFDRWCKFSKKKKTAKTGELIVRDTLASQLQGQTEVPCKTGFIDVLTNQELIEVKAIKDWKGAIGQALVYACEFPSKKPRIHLFGEASTEYKQMIISFCSQLNVAVSFED